MVQRDWLVRSRDRWRSIASFWSWYWKTARSLLTYSLTGRQPYFFPFILLPFLFTLLSLPSCLVLAANSAYRANLRALDFSPNDPIHSSRNWKNTWPFECKYPAHNHNVHSLATTNYPTSSRRNSPTHSSHLNIQKISSLFFQQQARKSSAPETFQRLFRLQNCRSRKSPLSGKFSKTFPATAISSSNQQQQPTTAINSSNQQQRPAAATSSSDQQQQPAAAISSSDQQQRPAAATSSSNQLQQSAAATNSSDQQQQSTAATGISNQHSSYQQHLHNQRRPPLVITTVPSSGYPTSSSPRISCTVAECNHRTKWLHFYHFSTFLNSFFVIFLCFAKI